MNILLLNAGLSWGGVESQALVLAQALRKNGHTVIVGCSREGYVKDKAEKLGFVVTELTVLKSWNIIALLKIIKIVIKEKIDVVFVSLGKEYWIAAVAAKLSGRKLIIVRHLLYKLNKHTTWLLSHHADKVLAVSKAVKEVMVSSGISVGGIEVVYNGIVMDRFCSDGTEKDAVRKELGIPKNSIVIGTAGKLHLYKGMLELVNALARVVVQHPDAFLLFVGDGFCRSQLEKEIRKFSLQDKILITGVRNDMNRMYVAMDIFVLASQSNEAFGMVLLEAMALSKPVIGTRVGGIPEIIRHEINGLLIPPADPTALADAISRYIRNPEFLEKMAQAGRKTVELEFSDDVLGQRYQKILQEL